jgi:hypothetical protein
MFAGLVGTVIGGITLYYLPGLISKVARLLGKTATDIAEHLDKEFPEGTANFNKTKDK